MLVVNMKITHYKYINPSADELSVGFLRQELIYNGYSEGNNKDFYFSRENGEFFLFFHPLTVLIASYFAGQYGFVFQKKESATCLIEIS